jgi:hypothetical protein
VGGKVLRVEKKDGMMESEPVRGVEVDDGRRLQLRHVPSFKDGLLKEP